MKKRNLALILMTMLALSSFAGCENKPSEGSKAPSVSTAQESAQKSEYNLISPADAVAAAKEGEKHVLDVREWSKYATGRIVGSEYCPIFPLDNEALVETMKAYAEKNLKDGKEIYLVCNSGQKGAQKATKVLKESGIDESLIFTVEGGAKALAEIKDALSTNRTEEKINWKYAKATDVLAIKDAQIVDVRDNETYAQGHLENSLQVGLKEIESSDAQIALFELANAKLDKSKPVYFLCYSGNKCAKTAISALNDAGFDVDNLFIIENGAKDEAVQKAFVK
ncbi:MAG: rhodanese-like domain-containing protein [Oscillospiraceae bacterium]